MKNNVPKLRFPEFSGEWYGCQLGTIAKFIGGGTPSTQKTDFWYGDIPWISSSDLIENNIKYINVTRFITQEAVNNSATKIIPVNSILVVSRVGVGKIAVNDKELCTSQDFQSAILENDNCYFIAYLLQIKTQKLIELNQGTSIKGFVKDDLSSLLIDIPRLEEQSKIADFLISVDDKIQQLTQKKELLEQYKKGIVQQMFSQQIRFKDDNGNNYPNWQEKDLKEIAEVNPKSENLPNNFYYVDLESVNNGRVGTLNYINSNDAPSRAQRVLSKNDILFQMVRPYQRNNLLFSVTSEDNYVASTGYAQLRARENYDYKFIFQMLLTENFVNTVMLRCTGTSYPAINSSDLSTITIKTPKYEEQVKIADFLTSLDDKITQVNAQLEQTKLFKKSLLQQLFI
ncbi:MAG: restriction endonuclease subunit S [Burkholderiales bacterium]|nr:restriction endonuclease subunit S [Burkholderiales bacterium]